MLNANCRNTTGSYLGHRARKTDGCHYFKTLMVIFFLLLMNESCLSLISAPWGQRLRQGGHKSGCSFSRYLFLSMCPTTEASQQNHTIVASIFWHMRMWKYTEVYVWWCTYTQVQMFWGTWACWYYFVFICTEVLKNCKSAVSITICYAADLFSLLYILLLSPHDWVIY